MYMNDKKDYLRGHSIFGSNGNLHQIEYAEKSVNSSEPSVGIQFENGIVLLSQKTTKSSPLLIHDSIEKIHRIDEQIGMAFSGHITDGRILAEKLREHTEEEKLQFGNVSETSVLIHAISEDIQDTIKSTELRPYGVSLLVGGIDFNGTPQLYKIDPSGAPSAWKGVAIGKNCSDIQQHIENNYVDKMDKDEALKLIIESITKYTGDKIQPELLDITIITEDDYIEQSQETIQKLINNIGDKDE